MNGAMPSGPSALIAATTMPAAAPRLHTGARPKAAAARSNRSGGVNCPAEAERDQRQHHGPACCTPARQPAAEAGDIKPRHLEILGPEKNPGEADEMEHDQGRDHLRGRPRGAPADPRLAACRSTASPPPCKRAPHRRISTPRRARCRRAASSSAGCDRSSSRPSPVAAERLVEVIAQPARQRDVPALPEFAQPLRPVGLVEIGREAEAEQRRQRRSPCRYRR